MNTALGGFILGAVVAILATHTGAWDTDAVWMVACFAAVGTFFLMLALMGADQNMNSRLREADAQLHQALLNWPASSKRGPDVDP